MRDQILAKLFGKRLANGPNKWFPSGKDYLEDHNLYHSGYTPAGYAESLSSQITELFGPYARIIIDKPEESKA